MRALLTTFVVCLSIICPAQRLVDDDNRRDPYSGLDPSSPRASLVNVQINGATRKGIGRINDKDVSFVWLHERVRSGYIGFRVKLVMMPRFGLGGIDKRASPDPLNDVDVSVSVGGRELRQAYRSRMIVDEESDVYNYTASVPKTEWRWEETIKPDGTRIREKKPYTVYVNESRRANYTRYVGQFDVIFAVPSDPGPDAPIQFDIRYGKANQTATWKWSQFTSGGWVQVDDGDRDRPSKGPSFAVLPIQIARDVRFSRPRMVEDALEDFIRGRRGDLASNRAIDRELSDLRIDVTRPNSVREADLIRLGQELRVDYVVYVVVDDIYGDSVTLRVWVADVRGGRLDLDGRSFTGRDPHQDDAVMLAAADILRPYFRR